MNRIKLRPLIFTLHRYLGLGIGLILVIVGLTGSLLVFMPELDNLIIQQRFGKVILQDQILPVEQLVKTVQTTYAQYPDWKVGQVQMVPKQPFYTVRLNRPDETQWEVFVNPYTGKIMGDRQRETAFFSRILDLHYALLSGDIGIIIVGFSALFLCILSITGIMLWPGWKKLSSGLKIKWNAHLKRRNFDIHKVIGIITAAFLGIIAFTGFCWNFYAQTEPMIYVATLTPRPPEVKSSVIADQSTLSLAAALRQSEIPFPDAATTFINLPIKPDDVFEFYKKVPKDSEDFNSYVKIDQYSGEILSIMDIRKSKLGDQVLNSFVPLHFGTFGGIITRILYVFVGLSPTFLLITGWTMWHYRQRRHPQLSDIAIPTQFKK
jgi:uncharacterized iron-regulated membrane protein